MYTIVGTRYAPITFIGDPPIVDEVQYVAIDSRFRLTTWTGTPDFEVEVIE